MAVFVFENNSKALWGCVDRIVSSNSRGGVCFACLIGRSDLSPSDERSIEAHSTSFSPQFSPPPGFMCYSEEHDSLLLFESNFTPTHTSWPSLQPHVSLQLVPPNRRPGMSDVSPPPPPKSGITGLSFDSTFLSPLLLA